MLPELCAYQSYERSLALVLYFLSERGGQSRRFQIEMGLDSSWDLFNNLNWTTRLHSCNSKLNNRTRPRATSYQLKVQDERIP